MSGMNKSKMIKKAKGMPKVTSAKKSKKAPQLQPKIFAKA
jgi:hypothetical protein